MDGIFGFYSDKVENASDGDVKCKFESFFTAERENIQKWYNGFRKNKQSKDNAKANKLKNEGNEHYRKKNFNQALDLYTKALCYAKYENEIHGLIILNRSAVFYMMENYENCLIDLKLCSGANCSEITKLKVRIRTIKCLGKLNRKEEMVKAVEETLKLLQESSQILNKDEMKRDILESSKEKPTGKLSTRACDNVPDVRPTNGFNNKFLHASSAVRLDYDEEHGRRVVANQELVEGDILFVEKAFVFAPVFNENMEFPSNLCYHCLKTARNSLPCKYCVQCIFCDEACRDNNWEAFHKFECFGMQIGLWYNTGIAFPALRALIKGIPSNFSNLTSNYRADVTKYGNENDNYSYFNKLISNVSKMDNLIPIFVTASVLIVYLERETNFFTLIRSAASLGKIGGLLSRHVAQFQCNSSLIKHKVAGCNDSVDVACGIYPSVSMMNHSCKSNVIISYYQDTVVVKAAQKIGTNEEIFNCYGIDYRYEGLEARQEKCQNIYFFTCSCSICKDQIKRSLV